MTEIRLQSNIHLIVYSLIRVSANAMHMHIYSANNAWFIQVDQTIDTKKLIAQITACFCYCTQMAQGRMVTVRTTLIRRQIGWCQSN